MIFDYIGFTNYFDIPLTIKVRYLRINNVLYYSLNDNPFTKMLDFSGFELFFDLPVTFGASLINKNTPQRYFKVL